MAQIVKISGTPQGYSLSTYLPGASNISLTAWRVTTVNGTVTAFVNQGTTTALDFGTLSPIPNNGSNITYAPQYSYSIDVAASGGGGSTNVSVSYSDGTNPNSGTSRGALGAKAYASFYKITNVTNANPTGTQTALSAGKKMLNTLSNFQVQSSELIAAPSGFFRLSLGVATGDVTQGEPAGAEYFTQADKTGTYTGTVTITATVA